LLSADEVINAKLEKNVVQFSGKNAFVAQ